MKIYLIRHAESLGNLEGFHQSHTTPLSEYGVIQAEKLAKKVVDIPTAILFSSPHTRAKQTADIVSRSNSKKVKGVDLLKELRRPSEVYGKQSSDPEVRKIREQIDKNFHKSTWRYSDEETYDEINKRSECLLQFLSKQEDEHVIAITHGDIIRSVVAKMFAKELLSPHFLKNFLRQTSMSNAGITTCTHNKLTDTWRLISWNETEHIKDDN